jgi:hypothetical protein
MRQLRFGRVGRNGKNGRVAETGEEVRFGRSYWVGHVDKTGVSVRSEKQGNLNFSQFLLITLFVLHGFVCIIQKFDVSARRQPVWGGQNLTQSAKTAVEMPFAFGYSRLLIF